MAGCRIRARAARHTDHSHLHNPIDKTLTFILNCIDLSQGTYAL